MPVNMRTTRMVRVSDLNFLIPELIGRSTSARDLISPTRATSPRWGPSMSACSTASTRRWPRSPPELRLPKNSRHYVHQARRRHIADRRRGQHLQWPWDNPDNLRKLNGLCATAGYGGRRFSLTECLCEQWNSTDQIPSRAIASGEIGLYGAFDPSDAETPIALAIGPLGADRCRRFLEANFYVIKSSLNLWNNFTYFLTDPQW